MGKTGSVAPPLNSIENEVKPPVMIDKEVEPGLTRDEKTYFR